MRSSGVLGCVAPTLLYTILFNDVTYMSISRASCLIRNITIHRNTGCILPGLVFYHRHRGRTTNKHAQWIDGLLNGCRRTNRPSGSLSDAIHGDMSALHLIQASGASQRFSPRHHHTGGQQGAGQGVRRRKLRLRAAARVPPENNDILNRIPTRATKQYAHRGRMEQGTQKPPTLEPSSAAATDADASGGTEHAPRDKTKGARLTVKEAILTLCKSSDVFM